MKRGIWPNRKRNWRRNASAPMRGPFKLITAERYSNGTPLGHGHRPVIWRWGCDFARCATGSSSTARR